MFKNCLIAEDQTLFAEILATALQAFQLVERSSVATSIAKAISMAEQESFDLVIADILFPEGNSSPLIKCVKSFSSPPKVIVLTGLSDSWHLQEILEQPVDAVLSKAALFDTLRDTIVSIAPEDTDQQHHINAKEIELLVNVLSRREKDVLSSLGAGLTNKEIAKELNLSVKTVETHRKNIARKTNLRGGALVRTSVYFRDLMRMKPRTSAP